MCSSNITKGRYPGIKCGGPCDKFYHVRCAKISQDLLRDIKNRSVNWLCETCRVDSNQSVIDSDVSDADCDVSLADIMKQLKKMEGKLFALEKLKSTVQTLQADNEALILKINQLEENYTSQNTKLNLMEADNDKPVQKQNATSITISGLPAKHGDVPAMILHTISKIENSIVSDDIVSIENIHKTNQNTQIKSNTNTPVLQNIFIVKLKSIELQQTVLSQMRKIKTLHTKDLDIILPQNHPNQQIRIMQRLSKFQAHLYHEAKKIKTKFNYKYLWCKSGQIYLRESTNSDVLRIHSMNDIFRLQSRNP